MRTTAGLATPDYQARVATALGRGRSSNGRTRGPSAVIPRYQKILFGILLVAVGCHGRHTLAPWPARS